MWVGFSFRRNALVVSLGAIGLLATSVISATTRAAPSSYQDAVLANNPYAYYRLGETSGSTTAADSSGNNRAGTYVNNPALGVPGAGVGDTAASFARASSQYLTTDQLAGFGSLMGSASWEFVFSTTTTNAQMGLGGTLNTGAVSAWEITLNRNAGGSTSANGVRLFLRDDNGNAIGTAFSAPNAFDGNFHHLVFTYDRTGTSNDNRIVAYLDGVQQTLSFGSPGGNSTPSTFSNFVFNTAFAARQNRAAADLFFDGTLDEVALYSSVLSPADVAAHAQAVIPEPSVLAMLGLGAAGLVLRRRCPV
jgi:hypothetical protein